MRTKFYGTYWVFSKSPSYSIHTDVLQFYLGSGTLYMNDTFSELSSHLILK